MTKCAVHNNSVQPNAANRGELRLLALKRKLSVIHLSLIRNVYLITPVTVMCRKEKLFQSYYYYYYLFSNVVCPKLN